MKMGAGERAEIIYLTVNITRIYIPAHSCSGFRYDYGQWETNLNEYYIIFVCFGRQSNLVPLGLGIEFHNHS